jgi:hypothetical protein
MVHRGDKKSRQELRPSVQQNNAECYVCPSVCLARIPFSSTLATNSDSSFLCYYVIAKDVFNILIDCLDFRFILCHEQKNKVFVIGF